MSRIVLHLSGRDSSSYASVLKPFLTFLRSLALIYRRKLLVVRTLVNSWPWNPIFPAKWHTYIKFSVRTFCGKLTCDFLCKPSPRASLLHSRRQSSCCDEGLSVVASIQTTKITTQHNGPKTVFFFTFAGIFHSNGTRTKSVQCHLSMFCYLTLLWSICRNINKGQPTTSFWV